VRSNHPINRLHRNLPHKRISKLHPLLRRQISKLHRRRISRHLHHRQISNLRHSHLLHKRISKLHKLLRQQISSLLPKLLRPLTIRR
jgi:hypothetical protein